MCQARQLPRQTVDVPFEWRHRAVLRSDHAQGAPDVTVDAKSDNPSPNRYIWLIGHSPSSIPSDDTTLLVA